MTLNYDLPKSVNNWYDFWQACRSYFHSPIISYTEIKPTMGVLISGAVVPASSGAPEIRYYDRSYIIARKEIYLAGLETNNNSESIKDSLITGKNNGLDFEFYANHLIKLKAFN